MAIKLMSSGINCHKRTNSDLRVSSNYCSSRNEQNKTKWNKLYEHIPLLQENFLSHATDQLQTCETFKSHLRWFFSVSSSY